MIALYIILGLVAAIILLLFSKVSIIFDYHGRAAITLKFLCFRTDGASFLQKRVFGKKEKPKKESETPPPSEKTPKQRPDPVGFAKFLLHVTEVVRLALKEFFDKATVDLRECNISVGTEDAALTAFSCSGAIFAANALCALLMRFSNFRCDNRYLNISPDFSSEKSSYSFRLVLSSRLIHILGVALRFYLRFFERKEKNHERNPIETSH